MDALSTDEQKAAEDNAYLVWKPEFGHVCVRVSYCFVRENTERERERERERVREKGEK